MKPFLSLSLAFLTAAALADPRASTNYTVSIDTTDAGGQRTSSAAYRNDGSLTEVADISTSANATVKHSYIGQLTDVTALQLTAASNQLDEGSTLQLAAWQALDDATFHAVPANAIGWSVQSGPLSGISSGGLATAATVYQNAAAIAQGAYSSLTGTLNLTVVNVSTDDIPGYSGDGLDDAWQVQYFGLNNPSAAPTFDADSDGHTNLFEFTAGLDPTLGTSRFTQDAVRPIGQPTQMNIVISPRLPDRTYTVKTSTILGPSAVWTNLTGFTISDNGTTRTITDTSAAGTRKFYRVQITKP